SGPLALSVFEGQSHRDHVRVSEVHLLKEALALRADLVGEESDALEVFALREIDHILDQLRSVPLTAEVRMDDDILQENDKTTHRGAYREKHIDHPDDLIIGPN